MNHSRLFKICIITFFLTAQTGLLHAAFTSDRLIIINNPSAMSAGVDSLIELLPTGNLSGVLVPESRNITGMSRTVYDPDSDHVYYSISSWPRQIFEIREINSDGNLIATHVHPDFGSGNISMTIAANGDLFIANNQKIFVKRAGQSDITFLFDLPYTGIGDLAVDQQGNLFLSDPFVSDCVYKIFPDGTTVVFADAANGLDSPYGLAVSSEGDLYIANYTHRDPAIIKITPEGVSSVFSTRGLSQGVIDLAFGPDQRLYTANRENDTIHAFETDGSATIFADGNDGLFAPSSIAFVTIPPVCTTDWDSDKDVDGIDLAFFALNYNNSCLEAFAGVFGSQE